MAMACSEGELSSLLENFICNLCLEPYVCPKSLPCLHSFCRECLQRLFHSRQTSSYYVPAFSFPCPVCKEIARIPYTSPRVAPVDSFPDNFHLVNMMQQLDQLSGKSRRCELCARDGYEKRVAQFWCSECNLGLCSGCSGLHRSLRVTRGHALASLGGGAPVSPCADHPEEALKSYCSDCERCICHRCLLGEHKGCARVVLLEEAVRGRAGQAEELLEELGKQTGSNDSLEESIARQREAFRTNKEVVVTDIRRSTHQLVEELRSQEDALVREVECFYAEEDNRLERLLAQCHNLKLSLAETRRLLESAVDCQNDIRFLNLLRTVRENLPAEEAQLRGLGAELEDKKRAFRFDINDVFHRCLRDLRGAVLGTVTVSTDRFTDIGVDSESVRLYIIPRDKSPRSDPSLDSLVTDDTDLATRCNASPPRKPSASRPDPNALTAFFNCLSKKGSRGRPRFEERGRLHPAFPECIVLLSFGEAFSVNWTSKEIKRYLY